MSRTISLAICKYAPCRRKCTRLVSAQAGARMAICLALSSDFRAPISVTRYSPDQSVSSRPVILYRCAPRDPLSKLPQVKTRDVECRRRSRGPSRPLGSSRRQFSRRLASRVPNSNFTITFHTAKAAYSLTLSTARQIPSNTSSLSALSLEHPATRVMVGCSVVSAARGSGP
jgi:hypothetical protein